LFINRFLKKTTVHENRKTEDNFVLKLMVFLILIVVSFVFRNSILQQAIEKLQLKLSRSTIAIYPYEKPLLTVSGVLLTEISLFLRMPIRCFIQNEN
jgi:hypothetical protein